MWCQWRERRRQLALGLAWMLGWTLYSLAYSWIEVLRAPIAGFYSTASIYGLIAPVLLAMRTSLGAASDRTLAFSSALPAGPRCRGWTTLLGGLVVLVVPIAAAALVVSLVVMPGGLEQAALRTVATVDRLPHRECMTSLGALQLTWTVAAVAVAAASTLYIGLSLLGTWLSSESRLGFAGTAVAAIWSLGLGLLGILEAARRYELAPWLGAIAPQGLIVVYGYGDAQGRSYGDLLLASRLLLPLAANLLVQAALAAWFVRRYGRLLPGGRRRHRRWRWPRGWRWPTVASRNRLGAMAWLSVRQALPTALPGLLIALLVTSMQLVETPEHRDKPLAERYADALPSAMWAVGMLWSVVVGAGMFADEVAPHSGEFWRTRPVSAGWLFGVKFAAGLAIVLAVLDGTTIALGWRSSTFGEYSSLNWAYIGCFVPLHGTLYAVAAAATCRLRRPAIAAMAVLAAIGMLLIAMETVPATRGLDPIGIYNALAHETPAQAEGRSAARHSYPAMLAILAGLALASAVLGWRGLGRYAPRCETH